MDDSKQDTPDSGRPANQGEGVGDAARNSAGDVARDLAGSPGDSPAGAPVAGGSKHDAGAGRRTVGPESEVRGGAESIDQDDDSPPDEVLGRSA